MVGRVMRVAAMIDVLSPRLKMALAGLLLALCAAFSAWQYLGRAQAENRAQRAESALTASTAQSAVLVAALKSQNDAVEALNKKLSDKTAEVGQAEREAAASLAAGQKRIEKLKAAPVPAGCDAAMGYLHDALTAPGDAQ